MEVPAFTIGYPQAIRDRAQQSSAYDRRAGPGELIPTIAGHDRRARRLQKCLVHGQHVDGGPTRCTDGIRLDRLDHQRRGGADGGERVRRDDAVGGQISAQIARRLAARDVDVPAAGDGLRIGIRRPRGGQQHRRNGQAEHNQRKHRQRESSAEAVRRDVRGAQSPQRGRGAQAAQDADVVREHPDGTEQHRDSAQKAHLDDGWEQRQRQHPPHDERDASQAEDDALGATQSQPETHPASEERYADDGHGDAHRVGHAQPV